MSEHASRMSRSRCCVNVLGVMGCPTSLQVIHWQNLLALQLPICLHHMLTTWFTGLDCYFLKNHRLLAPSVRRMCGAWIHSRGVLCSLIPYHQRTRSKNIFMSPCCFYMLQKLPLTEVLCFLRSVTTQNLETYIVFLCSHLGNSYSTHFGIINYNVQWWVWPLVTWNSYPVLWKSVSIAQELSDGWQKHGEIMPLPHLSYEMKKIDRRLHNIMSHKIITTTGRTSDPIHSLTIEGFILSILIPLPQS